MKLSSLVEFIALKRFANLVEEHELVELNLRSFKKKAGKRTVIIMFAKLRSVNS